MIFDRLSQSRFVALRAANEVLKGIKKDIDCQPIAEHAPNKTLFTDVIKHGVRGGCNHQNVHLELFYGCSVVVFSVNMVMEPKGEWKETSVAWQFCPNSGFTFASASGVWHKEPVSMHCPKNGCYSETPKNHHPFSCPMCGGELVQKTYAYVLKDEE